MDLHYLSSDLADSGLPSLISRAWATSKMAIWAERGWRNRDSGDYFGSRLSTPFRGHFGCLPAPLWLTELRFGPKIKMSEAPPPPNKKTANTNTSTSGSLISWTVNSDLQNWGSRSDCFVFLTTLFPDGPRGLQDAF